MIFLLLQLFSKYWQLLQVTERQLIENSLIRDIQKANNDLDEDDDIFDDTEEGRYEKVIHSNV
jgi:hypothetical protein